MKLNTTEKKAIEEIKRSGFTFYGDAMFKSFNQAKRCLDGLVRKGLVEKIEDQFLLTLDGRNS